MHSLWFGKSRTHKSGFMNAVMQQLLEFALWRDAAPKFGRSYFLFTAPKKKFEFFMSLVKLRLGVALALVQLN